MYQTFLDRDTIRKYKKNLKFILKEIKHAKTIQEIIDSFIRFKEQERKLIEAEEHPFVHTEIESRKRLEDIQRDITALSHLLNIEDKINGITNVLKIIQEIPSPNRRMLKRLSKKFEERQKEDTEKLRSIVSSAILDAISAVEALERGAPSKHSTAEIELRIPIGPHYSLDWYSEGYYKVIPRMVKGLTREIERRKSVLKHLLNEKEKLIAENKKEYKYAVKKLKLSKTNVENFSPRNEEERKALDLFREVLKLEERIKEAESYIKKYEDRLKELLSFERRYRKEFFIKKERRKFDLPLKPIIPVWRRGIEKYVQSKLKP